MEYSRVVGGNCAFQTNVPVYLATTVDGLNTGSIVCVGATGANAGYTISAATTTAAAKAAIGVIQVGAREAYGDPDKGQDRANDAGCFRVQSDFIADRTQAVGSDWLPAIINPDAMYFGWVSHTTAAATVSDTLVETITASVGTIVTVASVAQDVTGGFIYSHTTNSTGTATYSGSLRYVNLAIAAGSFGLATAMNVSTDSSLLYAARPGRALSCVSSGGDYLRSGGAAGTLIIQGLYIHDNYAKHDHAPLHPLRFWVDDGLDGLTGMMMYSEVQFTRPAVVLSTIA